MNDISIDIETFSSVDLKATGVYKYSESDDFSVLLFAYAVDNGEVVVIDLLNGEKIPDEIIVALSDNSIRKWAFNAQFERVCLSRFLGLPYGTYLDPEGWYCTKVWAATLSLPLTLADVGAVLNVEQQKMKEGKALIKYFCMPCNPEKNKGRIRHYPCDAPEKWEIFKAYNKRDVETEMAIKLKLSKFPMPESEWVNFHVDQRINDRGVALDMDFVHSAISLDSITKAELTEQLCRLTHLDNPNSVSQMKSWFEKEGVQLSSLSKKDVKEMLKTASSPLRDVLILRQQLAKSSVKKYTAMQCAVCKDGRAHGMFQFYGANRTGRFAGRLIQLHNLPQNHLPDLKEARDLVRSGTYEDVAALYESIPSLLSELIRTAFVPSEGCRFIVADYSAIEARVLSWFAGEEWRIKVFAEGGDIYCATASKMFHCKVVKNGENGHLRQKGKQAELSCGYGGSVGALKAMGALDMGMQEEELLPLVQAWRKSSPKVVEFWWAVDEAAKTSIAEKKTVQLGNLCFHTRNGILFITLPSGRKLAYMKPDIASNDFGGFSIHYKGIGTTKKWSDIESYGPKLVENIVQATARDLLTETLRKLDERGFRTVAHVHDEVIVEAPYGTSSVAEIAALMAETPNWANGLPLKAEGYECEFYKKD